MRQFLDARQGWAVGVWRHYPREHRWRGELVRAAPVLPALSTPLVLRRLGAVPLFVRVFRLSAGHPVAGGGRADSVANRSITDKPAGPGSVDFLGARRIAGELARFLLNRHTQPPVTIAITGDWGSGRRLNHELSLRRAAARGLEAGVVQRLAPPGGAAGSRSLLEQVRSQAIRPWWRPSGLWFRLRLVYKRHWAFQVAAAVLLAASAFGVIFSPARRRGAARPGITPSISRAGSGR